ncbi:hypothetical protein BX285_2570 [Streptomyces sp. 1114.5]|uniref:hypothetical protein n=1 Tax=Streptomyces sp. 1114.5 TaxID=1938830 RepID=UPI000EABC9D2|nr:hypothetical protein [Streptomyces sp. 1114.5]RKT18153.1 hypothetical protein BX285_2570 [Streptomyces sp. 1114.5]
MHMPTVAAVPAADLPAGTTALFLTLGSALVALYTAGPDSGDWCRWRCLGCGARSWHAEMRSMAREDANDHAATCRSIPWPRPEQA